MRQGRGARELDVAVGQAGHADLRGAGHLVRRRRDLRRRCRARTTPMRMATTTLLWCASADFQKILSQHVELYEALLRLQLRGACACCSALVEDLNTLPLRARLAKQILHLVRSYGVPAAEATRCASACSWRRKNWRSCWARRASASTRSSRRMEREDAIRIEPARPRGAVDRDKLMRDRRSRLTETSTMQRHDPGLRQLHRHPSRSPAPSPSPTSHALRRRALEPG